MGQSRSYFSSAADRRADQVRQQLIADQALAQIEDQRRALAGKIIMAVVDRIVNEIIRPGPVSEERECYEMAGELRALAPSLEELVKDIINVNNGVL
jgi:hypothetical protein